MWYLREGGKQGEESGVERFIGYDITLFETFFSEFWLVSRDLTGNNPAALTTRKSSIIYKVIASMASPDVGYVLICLLTIRVY